MAHIIYVPYATGEPRPTPPSDYQNIPTTPREFGAQIGAAEERLGEGALALGNFYGEVAADQATNNWQRETNKLLYGDPNVKGDQGLYGLKGQAAMDAGPGVNARIDQLRTQMRGQLWSANSQLQFDQYTRRMQNYLNGEIGRHLDQQSNIWATHQNKDSSDLATDFIASHASDQEQVDHGTADLMKASLRQLQIEAGLHPGDDAINATLQKARQHATTTQIRSLLESNPAMAQQVFNDQEPLLSGMPGYDALANAVRARGTRALGDDAFARASGGGGAGVIGGGRQTGTASQNIANNNPGNIKAPGGGWQSYPTPQAGVAAIGDWLQHAQAVHGLNTTRQLIDDPTHGYAPSADPGNAGKNLPEAAAHIVGINPDAPVNMADPDQRQRMINAILQQEQGPAGARRFMQYAQAGGGFSDVGAGAPAAQIPGIADAEAQYANTIANLNADPTLQGNPEAYQHAVAKAEQQFHAQNILAAARARDAKHTADVVADSYVQQMMKPGTDLVALIEQIRTDPNLEKPERGNLWKLAESHMVGDALGDVKKDGPGIYDALRRVTLEDNDPERISRPKDAIKLGVPDATGTTWLTGAGVTRVLQAIKEVKGSGEGAALTKIQNGGLAYIKHQLSFEEDYGYFKKRDPHGEDIFNTTATPAFFKYWQEGLDAGKTPQELVAKDQLDKLIEPFKRSPQQEMADRQAAGEEAPGGATAPAAGGMPSADDLAKMGPQALIAAVRAHPALRQQAEQLAIKNGWARPEVAPPIAGSATAPIPPAATAPIPPPPQ